MATFFNGKCGASPTSPLKAEEAGAVTLLRLHCFFHLQKSPSALRLLISSALFRICGAVELSAPSSAASAMAPKAEKAKAEKTKREKSEQAAKLVALRKRNVVFAPRLGARELWNKYYMFGAKKTKAHPRTRVYPAAARDLYPSRYFFFAVLDRKSVV